MAEVAVLAASCLLLSSSPAAAPTRKRLLPSAKQSADRKTADLLRRSPPLLYVDHRGSFAAPSTGRLLKHYARLVSKLALSGRLYDFLTIVEGILTSDAIAAADSTNFIAHIEARLVSEGMAAAISEGRLKEVLDFLGRADKLGMRPLSLLDGSAMKALESESARLLHQGSLEEFMRMMEFLSDELMHRCSHIFQNFTATFSSGDKFLPPEGN